uniref:Uncharacterized protein n=1 Tax=Ammopiptanthus mongolicus TaxID=126911 RepID=A0A385G291_AMMMO|nr:hypothetical protein [Ammopiptanthus mongolicus]AXV54313.1 hypothetical protein [Ammopiptanthus mongolicus]
MVSIALLLFRPNPNFVLLLIFLLNGVEPDRLDSFPCPPASHFVSFFFCIVAGMKTPDRPDFPKCPPPALLLSGSGFFASFQSSWSTGKKEMNECSFGKMYKNTPTETKAKGGIAASFLLDRGASIHQRRLKVLSEPCWIVTHHTALKPNLCDAARDRLSFKPLSFGSNKSSPLGAAAFLNEVYPNRISTSQIRLGLSSGGWAPGPWMR